MSGEMWCLAVQRKTEAFLFWRRKRLFEKKKKRANRRASRGTFLDWSLSFLWAIGVVLLVNQYLIQAYVIPSGSMEDALLIKDRIFVDKARYGPELIPGKGKLPGVITPRREDIVIFETPLYLSKGIAFDLLHRIVYMATLSMIDIDKDERGKPRVRFLVKRMVGDSGDVIRFRKGDLWIRPRGEDRFLREEEFKTLSGYTYQTKRLIKEKRDYETFSNFGRYIAYETLGLTPSPALIDAGSKMAEIRQDPYEITYWRAKTLHTLVPEHVAYRTAWVRYELGRYVPEGWLLPLGDNRDNSHDGRHFGPIPKEKILGKAAFRYLPIPRVGGIH